MNHQLDLQRRQQNGNSSASASATISGSASLVNGRAQPGIITITMPPIQSESYYKIAPSEYVTFGWNFSSLVVTPTALTVAAVGANGNTYPVGPTDGVIPGTAQSVVWYPYGYQTANPSLPLAQESYTLHIWAQGGPSAFPSPGYLEPNSELEFAMYTPQAYTPLTSGKSAFVHARRRSYL
ncbi:hypothetical protein DFJ58DRAFT_796142 [Suillus subalutaceus]|uniref:uncharacterized protein n=1 Tax=Suillus subalutaceus TaxID=48586 RepID=UPI001B86DEE3|nr:uncharacterized protein DFJ58DRAFT_796142 [Suillus subalutaceus]KAG1848513.1 hypothetical protein DFJ58DRAFT_796142 [Suillus subalutaceus]